MSAEDQARWNERYAQGAYAERTHPSAFLRQRLPAMALGAKPMALDVACGAGRNALYLAAKGWHVTAIDCSTVAIDRGRAVASEIGMPVQWLVADLESGLPTGSLAAAEKFDLIVMIRYVNPKLLQQLGSRLTPGGYLLVEQHMQTAAAVGGPQRRAFRVPRDALAQAVPELRAVAVEQGLFKDPDGKPMALSRLLAQRPGERSASKVSSA